MTGYGRGETDHGGTKFIVELNSVNRKQSDIVVNLPRDLIELEPRIRQEVPEPVEERECVGLNQGVGPAFGKRQVGCGSLQRVGKFVWLGRAS